MIQISKISDLPKYFRSILSSFEQKFTYPLGEGKSFTISHGQLYENFFRSIGSETIFVAHNQQTILGTLAVVERTLIIKGKNQRSLYIADLKIDPDFKQVLYRLLKTAFFTFNHYDKLPQFGIMMKGGDKTPEDFTGRLGFPQLTKLADIAIIRYPLLNGIIHKHLCIEALLEHYQSNLHDISLQLHEPLLRSKYTPLFCSTKDQSVSAVLEDTLNAKMLYSDSQELISGHLSCLNYKDATMAANFILDLEPTASKFYPALFFAVPKKDQQIFIDKLKGASNAPATIYGRNIDQNMTWQINTAEI
ncbi:hypothetical protein LNTAR_13332 [Lentisphaera araneosa HTCC2155]|uniref:Uncharacterized protein n=1 Tax=Lentisphaera araneosa HTCC2155 TaxID=313628 RepID=A6DRR5_9BACT|nr:hypothetical protein [Lentisphaera araneosa]EDM25734.1 hypothetical protein LNTAR_13332 [Lentisphaera araneosa HTCC2155]